MLNLMLIILLNFQIKFLFQDYIFLKHLLSKLYQQDIHQYLIQLLLMQIYKPNRIYAHLFVFSFQTLFSLMVLLFPFYFMIYQSFSLLYLYVEILL